MMTFAAEEDDGPSRVIQSECSQCPLRMSVCVCVSVCRCECVCVQACLQSAKDHSFYRKISSYRMGVDRLMMSLTYKIVARP